MSPFRGSLSLFFFASLSSIKCVWWNQHVWTFFILMFLLLVVIIIIFVIIIVIVVGIVSFCKGRPPCKAVCRWKSHNPSLQHPSPPCSTLLRKTLSSTSSLSSLSSLRSSLPCSAAAVEKNSWICHSVINLNPNVTHKPTFNAELRLKSNKKWVSLHQ